MSIIRIIREFLKKYKAQKNKSVLLVQGSGRKRKSTERQGKDLIKTVILNVKRLKVREPTATE